MEERSPPLSITQDQITVDRLKIVEDIGFRVRSLKALRTSRPVGRPSVSESRSIQWNTSGEMNAVGVGVEV